MESTLEEVRVKNEPIVNDDTTDQSSFKCQICNKAFTKSKSLKLHARIHNVNQSNKIPEGVKVKNEPTNDEGFCVKQEFHEETLSVEKKSQDKEPMKKLTVSVLNLLPKAKATDDKQSTKPITKKRKSQIEKEKKQTQTDINDKERRFKCKTCKKGFKFLHHLKAHVMIHTGERPFECETCGKAFRTIDKLKSHIRTHTGERPFKCVTCGKAFALSYDLKIHTRIHTGERPYKCKICNKAFYAANYFKIHGRIHTGEKPYTCTICTKNFNQIHHLKRHMKIHDREKSSNC